MTPPPHDLPPLTLRRAGPADAGKLALVGAATFHHSFATDHPGDGLVDHVERNHSRAFYEAALADPAMALWLLETPLGAAVGYAQLTLPGIAHPTDPTDLELKRIYVMPQWAGGGYGRRLIEAVEAEARVRGAARLLLCVYPDNYGAQAFYTRQGFADIGLRQAFMLGEVAMEDQVWVKGLG